jgi:hypothetical protein
MLQLFTAFTRTVTTLQAKTAKAKALKYELIYFWLLWFVMQDEVLVNFFVTFYLIKQPKKKLKGLQTPFPHHVSFDLSLEIFFSTLSRLSEYSSGLSILYFLLKCKHSLRGNRK